VLPVHSEAASWRKVLIMSNSSKTPQSPKRQPSSADFWREAQANGHTPLRNQEILNSLPRIVPCKFGDDGYLLPSDTLVDDSAS
jgi:hypothetical protein